MSDAYKDNAYGQHLPAFLRELLRDARVSGKQDASNPIQTHRRNFARQTFAFLDGSIACLRTLALVAAGPRLRSIEVAALYGNVELKAKDLKRKPLRSDPSAALCLVNHVLHTHIGLDEIDTASTEWQAFQRALQLRHRVTHPRRTAHLEISEPDVRDIEAALSWLERHVGTAFREVAATLLRPDLAEDVVRELDTEG